MGAVFYVVFLHERIGVKTPHGFSFEKYLNIIATYTGAFLSTPELR
jgi:hypothetical protein